jgi:hypothetical protein
MHRFQQVFLIEKLSAHPTTRSLELLHLARHKAAGRGGQALSPDRKLRETFTHAELNGDWGLGDGAKSPSG